MPSERYFADASLTEGAEIVLVDAESRHLVSVMRTAQGETVELINGRGELAQARLEAIGKKSATLRVLSVTRDSAPVEPVILAQAVPRSNRLDTILEKGTELGATEFWLFPGGRSERQEFSANQEQRMQGILVAAIKQCGRLHLPKIEVKPPLRKWTDLPCKGYYGAVDPAAPPFASVENAGDGGCIFFVGPEAGLTDHEEEKLRELGAQGVKLHSNILRTDTAGIAALSIWWAIVNR